MDSYDLERRPVAESNTDFSYRNAQRFKHVDEALRSGNRERIEFWIRDSNHHIHSVGQSLGCGYNEGAVIPDGTIKPPLVPGRYEPSDQPGIALSRTSGWISHGGAARSTRSTRP